MSSILVRYQKEGWLPLQHCFSTDSLVDETNDNSSNTNSSSFSDEETNDTMSNDSSRPVFDRPIHRKRLEHSLSTDELAHPGGRTTRPITIRPPRHNSRRWGSESQTDSPPTIFSPSVQTHSTATPSDGTMPAPRSYDTTERILKVDAAYQVFGLSIANMMLAHESTKKPSSNRESLTIAGGFFDQMTKERIADMLLTRLDNVEMDSRLPLMRTAASSLISLGEYILNAYQKDESY